MEPNSSRRLRIGVGGGVIVAASSVWETKMQSNKKVSDNAIVKGIEEDNKMRLKEDALVVNGKRWTLKSPVLEIGRVDSVKITRLRSIGSTPPVTPRRSSGVTSSVTPRRSISSDDKSLTVSVATKKTRSEGIEKTPGRVTKTRSELCTAIVNSGEFESVPLRKVNSLPEKSDNKTEHVDVPKEEPFKENPKIVEEVKEFDVCQETKEDEQIINNGDHEEEEIEEREVEKKSVDVKEINVPKENNNNRDSDVGIKYSQFHNRTASSPSSVRKIPPPVVKRATSVYTVPPSTGF